MNDSSIQRDKGWVKRFTACGPRLEEMVQAYRNIGFEVRLEPVALDNVPDDVCRTCFLVQSGLLFTVYTQAKPKRPSDQNSSD